MEQRQLEDDEPKMPCAEHCPYLLYGERQERHLAASTIGSLCVTDADLEYNLRAYQARDCEGAEQWDEEGGAIYCSTRSQVFGQDGEPGLQFRSETKELELLQRHHASRWELAKQEATRRFKSMVLGHIRDVAAGMYSQDEIALARIKIHHEPFATQRSHPDLSSEERSAISEKMKRIKSASDAVMYYDRYWELARQGKKQSEIADGILAENEEQILRNATVAFRFELYELCKEWF